jgi:hypothetical protein
MRFAEFWYASNGIFTDLREFCSEIAADAGLKLDANEAFRWLSTGGFASEALGAAGLGFFSLEAIKQFSQKVTQTESTWEIGNFNTFKMNVKGAKKNVMTSFYDGRIYEVESLVRDGHELPFTDLYGVVIQTLHVASHIGDIAEGFLNFFRETPWLPDINDSVRYAFHTMEAMIAEGWIDASLNPTRPVFRFITPENTACMGDHSPDNPVEKSWSTGLRVA